MGTKMAVAFANIFMSAVETEITRLSPNKPLVWKRYIDDIFSPWSIDKTRGLEALTRMLFSDHYWFVCEEWGPVNEISENAECFFVKEREALVVMIGFRLSWVESWTVREFSWKLSLWTAH